MAAVQLLRILGMKYMNEPKNPLTEKVGLSFKTLQQTNFETDADMSKEVPAEQEFDLPKILEDGD